MSSLYILEVKKLSEVSLANMFSHGRFPIYFPDVFFSHAEVFHLMESHLFILSFISLALGDVSMKILLHGISEIFLPMFFSRTFMVSPLVFKSFIHLEFILVYGVSWCSSFSLLCVLVQIS